jgi:hypothetical protein
VKLGSPALKSDGLHPYEGALTEQRACAGDDDLLLGFVMKLLQPERGLSSGLPDVVVRTAEEDEPPFGFERGLVVDPKTAFVGVRHVVLLIASMAIEAHISAPRAVYCVDCG